MDTLTYRIAVYYNCNSMAMISGYKASDRLRKVIECPKFSSDKKMEDILRWLFEHLNDNPPTGERSMSVGDVVDICIFGIHTRYACATRGWIELRSW